MLQKLNIQLFVNPECQLEAIDNTNYDDIDITKHVSLEFLVSNDGDKPEDSSIIIKKYKHNRDQYIFNTTNLKLGRDGVYCYYKFLIPKISHLITEADEVYKINTDGDVFYHNGNIRWIGEYSSTNDSLDGAVADILDKSIDIEKYLDIFDYVKNNNVRNTLYYQKYILSYCKLQSCLMNLQKQIIFSSHSCSKCESDSETRYKRDFLLSALYVLDYLGDIENFDEAQKIIENLATCGTLCEDILNNNDCGCGTAK